jgi:CRP-like cAMP-binding protein
VYISFTHRCLNAVILVDAIYTFILSCLKIMASTEGKMITPYNLMRHGFFANLDEDFVSNILSIGEERKLENNAWLFKQDQEAKKIYLITEGKLALTIRFGEEEVDRMNPYMRGEIIGWSALVKPHIYTMGAVAEQPSTVIGFRGREMLSLMDERIDQGYIILQNLTEIISERLINSNIQLMSLKV